MHALPCRGFLLTCAAVVLFCSGATLAFAGPPPESFDEPPAPQQSRTGPTPPAVVVQRDALQPAPSSVAGEVLIDSVPIYFWRHGCGPTALGMVVGYYDGLGYENLIDGAAAEQTDAVNQAIASGGYEGHPFGPGSERHYEDYALPKDEPPTMLVDDFATAGRQPHADDCIADFMLTSRSTRGNYYGWSWSNDIIPAWQAYASSRSPCYQATGASFYMTGSNPTLTWSVLTGEIDAGRPMEFLVDSDGNGGTDHFVAVIGYRDSPTRQYASRDTWYAAVRWQDFAALQSGKAWGIWGGWSLRMSCVAPAAGAQASLAGEALDPATLRVSWEAVEGAGSYEAWAAEGALDFDIGGRACSAPDPYTCRQTSDLWADYAHLGDPAVHHAYRVRAVADCGAVATSSAGLAEFEFELVR